MGISHGLVSVLGIVGSSTRIHQIGSVVSVCGVGLLAIPTEYLSGDRE